MIGIREGQQSDWVGMTNLYDYRRVHRRGHHSITNWGTGW